MCPTHTITEWQPTDEERRAIQRLAGPDRASYIYCAVVFGIIPTAVLIKLGGWLGTMIPAVGHGAGIIVGAAFGLAVFLYALLAVLPFERRERRRAAGDAESHKIEVITVRNARVAMIDLLNDESPALALDIGGGKILLLQGQWLLDHHLYGAPYRRGDAFEEFMNGEPAPSSFPNQAFTLRRFPLSGHVTSIQVQGDYAVPVRTLSAMAADKDFRDSELLEGDFEQLPELLRREFRAEYLRAQPVGT